MAICFELVVNFGENAEAARAAASRRSQALGASGGQSQDPPSTAR